MALDGTGAPNPGVPAWEYVNHLRRRARLIDHRIDLGAYEYRPLETFRTPWTAPTSIAELQRKVLKTHARNRQELHFDE